MLILSVSACLLVASATPQSWSESSTSADVCRTSFGGGSYDVAGCYVGRYLQHLISDVMTANTSTTVMYERVRILPYTGGRSVINDLLSDDTRDRDCRICMMNEAAYDDVMDVYSRLTATQISSYESLKPCWITLTNRIFDRLPLSSDHTLLIASQFQDPYSDTIRVLEDMFADDTFDAVSCPANLEPDSDAVREGLTAMGWGALSAFSFPLGAVVSLFYDPTLDTVGKMLGFGNGALLCALTVEMFAQSDTQFRELRNNRNASMANLGISAAIGGAVLGCLAFIFLNRKLTQHHNTQIKQELSAPPSPSRVERDLPTEILTEQMLPPNEPRSGSHPPTPTLASLQQYSSLPELPSDQRAGAQWDSTHSLPGPHQRRKHSLMNHRESILSLATSPPSHTKGGGLLRTSSAVLDLSSPRMAALSLVNFRTTSFMDLDETAQDPVSPSESGVEGKEASSHGSSGNAMGVWLGVMLDGIPESMVIGFMTRQHRLSYGFIVGVFLANFPEALSASTLMRHSYKSWKIVILWSSLMVMTSVLAGATAFALPGQLCSHDVDWEYVIRELIEGMAGGAMLCMLVCVAIPESFHLAQDMAGLWTLIGFLITLVVIALTGNGKVCVDIRGPFV